jgi:DNA polymerase IIIc chi subunit
MGPAETGRRVRARRDSEGRGGAATVVLHRLAGSKKALDACRLVEELYTAGRKVTVFVADAGRAAMFNDYLWTFAQHSFVPHVLWDGKGEVGDPVVVVTGALANPNGSDVLLIGDRIDDPGQAVPWGEVHDFVTSASEDEGKAGSWAAAGFTVEERRGVSTRGSR